MDALASSVTEDPKKLDIHIKNITQADLLRMKITAKFN
jgi:hypothetical protein